MQDLIYRFGDWELHVQSRLLLKKGEPVFIHSRSFDILRLMIEHTGQVVSKQAIISETWKGVHVNENSVDKQVSIIRGILGKNLGGRPYIETVPREGYRFVPI